MDKRNPRAKGTNPRAVAKRFAGAARAVQTQTLIAHVEAWVAEVFEPDRDMWELMPPEFNPWQREQADRIWRERLEAQ